MFPNKLISIEKNGLYMKNLFFQTKFISDKLAV